MILNIVAQKLGMTHIYTDNGTLVPLTILKLYDNCVLGYKDVNNKKVVIIGFNKIDNKSKLNKPISGIFLKKNLPVHRIIKDSAVDSNFSCKIGNSIKISSILNKGSMINVSGFSIGKGFAGSMKRHNFGGLEATHGVSISHRSHGSTGQRQDPGKVFKGKKMAGHMGNKKVTIKNLEIFDIDLENDVVALKGSIPGSAGKDVILKIDS